MRSRSSSLLPRDSPCLHRGLPGLPRAPGRAPRAPALMTRENENKKRKRKKKEKNKKKKLAARNKSWPRPAPPSPTTNTRARVRAHPHTLAIAAGNKCPLAFKCPCPRSAVHLTDTSSHVMRLLAAHQTACNGLPSGVDTTESLACDRAVSPIAARLSSLPEVRSIFSLI